MYRKIISKKSKQKSKRYQNPDGSFKEMTCPDDPSNKSKFCGCVRYFMSEEGGNLSLERAKKMCGYIKRRKYGSEEYDLQGDVIKLETPDEDFFSDVLDRICVLADRGTPVEKRRARRLLSYIWDGEDWLSIKDKLDEEGFWYVWWMYGVHSLMAKLSQGDTKVVSLLDKLNIFKTEEQVPENLEDLEKITECVKVWRGFPLYNVLWNLSKEQKDKLLRKGITIDYSKSDYIEVCPPYDMYKESAKYGSEDYLKDINKRSSWSDWRIIENDPRWHEIEKGFVKLYELYKEYLDKYPMTSKYEQMNIQEKDVGGTGNIGTMAWTIRVSDKLANDLGIDIRVIEPVRNADGFGGRFSEWADYDLLDLYYDELKKIGFIKQSRRFGKPRTDKERLERICKELNKIIKETGNPIKYEGYSIIRFYPEETAQFGLNVYGILENGKKLNLGSEILNIYREVLKDKPTSRKGSIEKHSYEGTWTKVDPPIYVRMKNDAIYEIIAEDAVEFGRYKARTPWGEEVVIWDEDIEEWDIEPELRKKSVKKYPRRFGKPRTDEERLRRHRRQHPEDEVETIEDLPPRGTGLRKANKDTFRYLVMYFDDKEGKWNEITRDKMLKALSDNYDNAEELVSMLEKGELPTVTTSFAAYKVQPIINKESSNKIYDRRGKEINETDVWAEDDNGRLVRIVKLNKDGSVNAELPNGEIYTYRYPGDQLKLVSSGSIVWDKDSEKVDTKRSSYKRLSKRYHPPTIEELKPEPKKQVDTFLEWAGYPKKGSDVTDLLIDYFWEYSVVKENRKPMIKELKRRGFKVREKDIETKGSLFQKFAWEIKRKNLSEEEHEKRIKKIKEYEKKHKRTLTQEEAEKMYYELGRS